MGVQEEIELYQAAVRRFYQLNVDGVRDTKKILQIFEKMKREQRRKLKKAA